MRKAIFFIATLSLMIILGYQFFISGVDNSINNTSITIFDNKVIDNEIETNEIINTDEKPEVVNEAINDEENYQYTLPEYYEYNGGDLPKDTVTSITYKLDEIISMGYPIFTFQLAGSTVESYGLTVNKDKYYLKSGHNIIDTITISCKEISYEQTLKFEETFAPNIDSYVYGFSLADWNFDGFLDISLWAAEGGTSLNSPHYYWLWDDEKNMYVDGYELMRINDGTWLEIDTENNQIKASARLSPGYYSGYYEWISGNLVLVKTDKVSLVDYDAETDTAKMLNVVMELLDGELQITHEEYVEFK